MLKRNMSIQTRKKSLLGKKKVPASKAIQMKNLLQIDKDDKFYSAYGKPDGSSLLSYRTKQT